MSERHQYGLIGRNIDYSFSRNYFKQKFDAEGDLKSSYENFDIDDISKFPNIIADNPLINGLNVTIPYKESIIPYLDKVSKKAAKIGAVNTVRITDKGKLIGYNTDWYGFYKSLKPLLKGKHAKALILGTGGASKAIEFALDKLNIKSKFVSRNPNGEELHYNKLTKSIFEEYLLIINTTPLGTFPTVDKKPDLNYSFFTKNHIAFDLIYNPEQTEFLRLAKENNAETINGYQMLIYQAEKAWGIWNR